VHLGQSDCNEVGWFKNIFGSERKTLTDLGIPGIFEYGFQTAANINGAPHIALQCQPFAAGHRIRIETLGTLSLKFYRREGDTNIEAKDHPLYHLLHDRPNPWTSAVAFIMQMESDTILHGDAYALANRVNGKIIELIRLDPSRVVVKYDPVTLEPSYSLALADGARPYAWQDILHIPSPNGSVARNARAAIGLSIALEQHAGKILSSGARPSGLFKSKRKFSDVAYERLRKSWNSTHTGEGAGGTVILEEDGDFVPLTFSSVDLQFQEMRAYQVLEIGRGLGIPPTLLYELGRATWANAEEMGQTFRTFTVLGRCKVWEGAISRLLTEEEQKIYYPEFLTDSLVRADLAARFAAYAQACGGPWLVVDEVRAIDNLPKVAGGDVLRPPANASGVTADTKPVPARTKPTAVAA
jgi:HK97 family phage portal protein